MKNIFKQIASKLYGPYYEGGLLLTATFLFILMLILMLDHFGIINLIN